MCQEPDQTSVPDEEKMGRTEAAYFNRKTPLDPAQAREPSISKATTTLRPSPDRML
jgi:hypothetical protein